MARYDLRKFAFLVIAPNLIWIWLIGIAMSRLQRWLYSVVGVTYGENRAVRSWLVSERVIKRNFQVVLCIDVLVFAIIGVGALYF
jgi:hypothetical protein